MVRTERYLLVFGAGVFGTVLLAGCGADERASAEPNPATEIAPPPESSAAAGDGDWNLPDGVFRAVTPKEGTLDLHIERGEVLVYAIVDGIPELGWAAECVPDAPSTIACTGRDGLQMVFSWEGTDEALEFDVLSGGEQGDRDVWEGAPWLRVP